MDNSPATLGIPEQGVSPLDPLYRRRMATGKMAPATAQAIATDTLTLDADYEPVPGVAITLYKGVWLVWATWDVRITGTPDGYTAGRINWSDGVSAGGIPIVRGNAMPAQITAPYVVTCDKDAKVLQLRACRTGSTGTWYIAIYSQLVAVQVG